LIIEILDKDRYPLWRDQISRLIDDSSKINFSDYDLGSDYGKEKAAKAEEYMKTGAATIFAAHEEDVLVGWVWSHPIERFNKTRLHIAEIAIDERFRGKGLGSELLSFVENYAAENGFEEMDLMVTAENDAAVEFYKKDGFEAERYLMKKVL
jgi:ribosomal protein S18 acetylase RimI-like enzyme